MPIEGSPLAPSPPSLHTILTVGCDTWPEDTAVVSSVRRLTWRELEGESDALAAAYLDHGLEPGDRLASLMPNRIDLLVHYLACFKAGFVATPLNYRYTPREIDHALEISGARALLAHAERSNELAKCRVMSEISLGPIWCEGSGSGQGPRLEALVKKGSAKRGALEPPDPLSPAAIFFTSGSTGPAKGVTHTHETLRWMFASAVAGLQLTEADVCLPGSSLSHLGSFMRAFAALSVGARVVVARVLEAHEMIPLIRDQRPTLLAMLPAALTALVRDHDVVPEDLASLRLCVSGADKISSELLEEFSALAGFPIDEGYGMTEVGLATMNPPSGPIKAGSIGKPVSGLSLSIRDDNGTEVGAGKVGRIWIRSRSQMAGYWNAPEATRAIIKDGWLDTGDLAHADAEDYVWFFGRKKQVIVHDGSNISPFEVEGALVEHPAVELAGVVGIHDLVHGENVRAYVTLRPEHPRPTSDELVSFCRERVGYKAPEEIVVLDEMPLNPTGKLDRARLRHMAEHHLHPGGSGAPSPILSGGTGRESRQDREGRRL
jgi:long-chain acyl-CoA synthetase